MKDPLELLHECLTYTELGGWAYDTDKLIAAIAADRGDLPRRLADTERIIADVRKQHRELRDEIDSCNLVDRIARNRGWAPLVVGETMTVGFGDGTEYVIKRNNNRFNKP